MNSVDILKDLFQEIEKYGVPIRVRTDYGGENCLVWEQMYEKRGFDSKPVIAGSSVHNERVERLNFDINTQVSSVYKTIFMDLENRGVLDFENDTDLFCLHYVFMPTINKSLHEFTAAHNHHIISTERNYTPIQLFYHNQHLIPLHATPSADPHGGIAAADLLDRELPHVNVLSVGFPLSYQEFQQLTESVDPLSTNEDPKVLYQQVTDFVGDCLHH